MRRKKVRDILKAARLQAREDYLASLRDNRRQRSSKFKSKKDYDRKNKGWRNDDA